MAVVLAHPHLQEGAQLVDHGACHLEAQHLAREHAVLDHRLHPGLGEEVSEALDLRRQGRLRHWRLGLGRSKGTALDAPNGGGRTKVAARRASRPAAFSAMTWTSESPCRRDQTSAPPSARSGRSSARTHPAVPARNVAPPGNVPVTASSTASGQLVPRCSATRACSLVRRSAWRRTESTVLMGMPGSRKDRVGPS